MKREELIRTVSSKLKLIRTEYGITQEAMSEMLGISKKTLVETEKGRRELSWTEVIAVVSVFEKSEVLQGIVGGEAGDLIHALAFEDRHIKYPPTMGGKVWWRVIDEKNGIRLQQNYVSGHYRLLDKDDCRLISSFDRKEVEEYRDSLGRQ
jgi:DNA-binding XRE family transcriptional regulator